MYQGFMRFGGREVINAERTMAYIAAGFGQPGVEFDCPVGDPTGLASVLGHEPYVSPILDEAPWYDVNRPETHGFAGVLPLGITGLNGTTRSVTVAEKLGNGGVALAQRRSSKTIAVSAMLVGADTEAMHAGLQWLTSLLERSCEGDLDCAGSPLELFTVNPGPVATTEDVRAAMEDHLAAPTGAWRAYRGRWDPTVQVFSPSALTAADAIDGGTPGVTPAPGINDPRRPASSMTPIGADVLDGGSPADPFRAAAGGRAGLAADYELTCLSHVTATWTVGPVGDDDATIVRLGAVDGQGGVLEVGGPVVVTEETELVYDREHPPWDQWYPAVFTSDPLHIAELVVAHRPDLDPQDCVSPYRRTYADVRCVAGPTIVEEMDVDDCGTQLWRIEWTMVAGDAYRYGDADQIAAGVAVAPGVDPLLLVTGAIHTYSTVTRVATACAEPVAPVSCALDPTRPGLLLPPAAPVIAESGLPVVTTYRRSLLQLNPDVLPDYVPNALTFRFENDATAKRGVRVRLFQHDDPNFATHTECGFDQEFWIDYIDPGAVLVIDASGSVVAVCDDGSIAPAGGVMRGPYRSSFEAPLITCGGRWWVAVDVPDGTGLLTWALSSSIREG